MSSRTDTSGTDGRFRTAEHEFPGPRGMAIAVLLLALHGIAAAQETPATAPSPATAPQTTPPAVPQTPPAATPTPDPNAAAGGLPQAAAPPVYSPTTQAPPPNPGTPGAPAAAGYVIPPAPAMGGYAQTPPQATYPTQQPGAMPPYGGVPQYGTQPNGTQPYGAQPYGAQPYGAQPYGAQPYPGQFPQPGQKAHPVRDFFAGTIAAVLNGVTGGVAGTVTQGINGSITGWFARKQQQIAGTQYSPYGAAGYPQTGVGYPQSTYPQATYPQSTAGYPQTTYPSATAYPQTTTTYPQSTTAYPQTTTYPQSTTAYPQTTTYPQPATGYPQGTNPYPQSAIAYPQATPYPATAIQVFDPSTGQATMTSVNAYAGATTANTAFSPGTDSTALFAGVAYEVHVQGPAGDSVPINAATYEFHTGDRFTVYLRPSVPGHLLVFNVNPFGKQTRIDSTDVAAGMLTTIGPYQFTDNTGDESLRLVLSPCTSPTLLASTRDIVNVSSTAQSGSGVAFSSCSAMGSRGISDIKVRDIQKVALDGTTSYALDPIAKAELASGQLAPREITIVFHHR